MALAGCTGVFIGFESLNAGNIEDAGKRSPAPDDYARRVAILHDNGIQVNGSFVLGFDHDSVDVFERTVRVDRAATGSSARRSTSSRRIPARRCSSRWRRDKRIVHRDWRLYDTAHVVFEPKRMTGEELLATAMRDCYRRLFSHRSIWRRRPKDWRAVPAYLAMSYLYKRSNRIWHLLIRFRLTAFVWRPLVELTRRRHVRFRRRLAQRGEAAGVRAPISAGV